MIDLMKFHKLAAQQNMVFQFAGYEFCNVGEYWLFRENAKSKFIPLDNINIITYKQIHRMFTKVNDLTSLIVEQTGSPIDPLLNKIIQTGNALGDYWKQKSLRDVNDEIASCIVEIAEHTAIITGLHVNKEFLLAVSDLAKKLPPQLFIDVEFGFKEMDGYKELFPVVVSLLKYDANKDCFFMEGYEDQYRYSLKNGHGCIKNTSKIYASLVDWIKAMIDVCAPMNEDMRKPLVF